MLCLCSGLRCYAIFPLPCFSGIYKEDIFGNGCTWMSIFREYLLYMAEVYSALICIVKLRVVLAAWRCLRTNDCCVLYVFI